MSGSNPKKPVDPGPHLDAVDAYMNSTMPTLKNLAKREDVASDAPKKPGESVPTDTLSSKSQPTGKATGSLDALEKLNKEKEDVRAAHEDYKARVRVDHRGPPKVAR